ncbi:YggS family pyridoxal phosphate-dependent enzyme [Corynebacterium sp. 335C]
MSASDVRTRLDGILGRIADAARSAGRDPGEVRLLPVSKVFPADVVMEAWTVLADAGCDTLAENRVQEASGKSAEIAPLCDAVGVAAPRWAVIGPLQTNKAGQLVEFADEFQALDRPKVAAALQRRLEAADRELDVLVQVNTSGEGQKSGVDPAELEAFVARFGPGGDWPRLRLRGLMTMAMRADGTGAGDAAVRGCFARLRELRDDLRDAGLPEGVSLDELSMGMSGDFEAAIAEGATTVRVGQAIFGPRPAR